MFALGPQIARSATADTYTHIRNAVVLAWLVA